MAETIRYAVVCWNRSALEAQAAVIETTIALVHGNVVKTVRQSSGPVEHLPKCKTVGGLSLHFSVRLGLPAHSIAIVEVDHAL